MYSWILLTWTSYKESIGISNPVLSLTHFLNFSLFYFLIYMNWDMNLESFENGINCYKLSKEVTHSSTPPKTSLIKFDKSLLQQSIHLLGVTPFVLFWILLGNNSLNSLKIVYFNKSVWSWATPLTEWLHIIDKYAILTFFGYSSSIKLILPNFYISPGYFLLSSSICKKFTK